MKFILSAAPLALFATIGHAQDAPAVAPVQEVEQTSASQSPQVMIAPAVKETVLRVGMPIPLVMAEEITTKKKAAKVGQRVRLEVAEDIRVDGVVVIPKGTPAIGELTEVRNKGMWGKSGKLIGRVLYMRVGDRQIRLSGAFDDKGIAGTAGVVGAAVLLPVAGFFITGTSATLPRGGPVNGFLDEDVPITINGAAAPAPLVVDAPANPASAQAEQSETAAVEDE